MLQISSYKFVGCYGNSSISIASGFCVTKGDLAIFKSFNPIIRYSNFKDIVGKVFNLKIS